MTPIRRGDMVTMDGLLAAVVGVEGDPGVPEEHVALWFGDPIAKRTSEGGTPRARVEAWSVPAESCVRVTVDLQH
ncbi:MAG: hypothetical protein U0640_00840 [Phycisphaerales bacterium]